MTFTEELCTFTFLLIELVYIHWLLFDGDRGVTMSIVYNNGSGLSVAIILMAGLIWIFFLLFLYISSAFFSERIVLLEQNNTRSRIPVI